MSSSAGSTSVSTRSDMAAFSTSSAPSTMSSQEASSQSPTESSTHSTESSTAASTASSTQQSSSIPATSLSSSQTSSSTLSSSSASSSSQPPPSSVSSSSSSLTSLSSADSVTSSHTSSSTSSQLLPSSATPTVIATTTTPATSSATSATPVPTSSSTTSIHSDVATSSSLEGSLASSQGLSATTTFNSTFYITTTNSQGQTVTSAPPYVTETSMVTGSNGAASYVTIVAANPTPISVNNDAASTSEFFRDKGAVAGVFLIVGLAAGTILLFILFCIRRRLRARRIEHDTVVASTLAEAGFNRAPVDRDDEAPNMSQRLSLQMTGNNALRDATRTLLGTRGRPSSRYLDEPVAGPQTTRWDGFDPYAALGTVHPPLPATLRLQRKDGYAPARTNSPPPDTFVGRPVYGQGYNTDGTSSAGLGHIAGTSASSHDLLLGYRRYEGETSTATNASNTDVLSPPPRNPKRLEKSGGVGTKMEEDVPARGSAASSIYSVASEDPFDDPTTSRLVIRNLPDSSSAGVDASREPSRQERT